MVAAQDMKLNYGKIATMYGQGATYDAVEGRFRIIKRKAAELVAEVESGSRPPAPPRGGSSCTTSFATDAETTPKKTTKATKFRSTNTTPRAAKKEKVLSGRVTKAGSPVKKAANVAKGIKEEMVSSEGSNYEDLGMEVDAEGVAAELGFDGHFDFSGVGEMEV
ncbi:MAG: hypothetical protein Q9207_008155 [Kuettlingeria erythrocarpa]